MERREFLGTMTGGLLAVPLAAEAQQPAKVPRVGLLLTPSPEHPIAQATLAAFRQGLRERGYVEGQTIVIEPRFAPERLERYRDLVAELARLKVDVIVVGSTAMARCGMGHHGRGQRSARVSIKRGAFVLSPVPSSRPPVQLRACDTPMLEARTNQWHGEG